MGTIHLTKEVFLEKVVNYETNPKEWKYLGDKPCLIDFYADWCGPCKAVAPILEELAAEYEGKIYIYKINTDEEQELAGAFGIRNIPSILFVPMEGQPRMSMKSLRKIYRSLNRPLPLLTDYAVTIPPGGRTDAFVQTVITWSYNDKAFRTAGLDADQTEAAIKATVKMLNIIENWD